MCGTHENKDAVVMLLCAVMSGQLGHGKRTYGQRLEQCAAYSYFGWMDGQMKKVVNESTAGLSLFSYVPFAGKIGCFRESHCDWYSSNCGNTREGGFQRTVQY